MTDAARKMLLGMPAVQELLAEQRKAVALKAVGIIARVFEPMIGKEQAAAIIKDARARILGGPTGDG